MVLLSLEWHLQNRGKDIVLIRFLCSDYIQIRCSRLHPSLCWPICRQAVPQGQLPHHRASHQLAHDARPQQRQEAQGRPHRRPLLRDRESIPIAEMARVLRQERIFWSNISLPSIDPPDDGPEPYSDRRRCHRQLRTPRGQHQNRICRYRPTTGRRCLPLRRVNQAIALLTTGAREASFRNVKSIAECLAEELINAAKGKQQLVRDQEEGRVGACSQEQPVKSYFFSVFRLCVCSWKGRETDFLALARLHLCYGLSDADSTTFLSHRRQKVLTESEGMA